MTDLTSITTFSEFNEFYLPYFEGIQILLKFVVLGVFVAIGIIIILIATKSWSQ